MPVVPVSGKGAGRYRCGRCPSSDRGPALPRTITIRLRLGQHGGVAPLVYNVSHRHPAPAVVPGATGILHLGNPETTIVAGERHVTKETGAPAVDRMAPNLLIAFQADPEAYREDNGYVISVQMCPRSVGRRWRSVRHWRSGSGYRLWRMAWKVISSDSLSQTTHLSPNPIGWDMPWTSQATLDLVFPDGQPAEEIPDPLLYQGLGSQAQVSGGLLSHPAPDGLIGASVRAVARQSLPS